MAASDNLLAWFPDAINVWLLRVGIQDGSQHRGRVSPEGRVIEGTVNAAYDAVDGSYSFCAEVQIGEGTR